MISNISGNTDRERVSFFYGSGSGFSGQRFAIELIVQGLRQRNWPVQTITTPLRNRVKTQSRVALILETITMMLRLLVAWIRGLWAIFFTSDITVISPGQTKFALVRDGLPLLVKGLFTRDNPVVISLHGNLIVNWSPESFQAKILCNLVRAARYITVLGPNQKAHLIRLGMPVSKIVIIDNTCSISPIPYPTLKQKHSTPSPINVLYLSNLIESKGYPEFIEAVAKLSQTSNIPLQAVLCGKITIMDSDERFAFVEQVELWIKNQLDYINQSQSVQICWINGADGEAKEKLFREAHIFVLPSRYKVEAQPIAIIEALASGCAVITSNAGEIPAMVSSETAIMLDNVSFNTIAEAIRLLCQNPDKRKTLAKNGLELFNNRFTYKTYIDSWENLLLNISDSESMLIERD